MTQPGEGVYDFRHNLHKVVTMTRGTEASQPVAEAPQSLGEVEGQPP